jgi:2,4-didehydro-3-deoxy-L-rhamnonate hydrolase
MRLATILSGRVKRVAVSEAAFFRLLPSESGDMVDIIRAGRPVLDELVKRGDLETVGASDVDILAPIQRFSRDVLCTGWNYWDHFEESKGKREGQDVDRPKAPTFFTKSPYVAAAPTQDIGIDDHISAKWDYEAEVGVVIGKRGRSFSRSEASDAVFGYFLANDVSQRDLQRRHGGQWLKGKSIDATMPFGPFIVTPDELDVPEILLELELNGRTLQSARLKQMAFSIPELIAELSFGMTLDAGDILLTGTPAGIGNAREPPVFLKPGDEMIVRATGLGELRNRLVARDLHGQTDIPSMSRC